MNYKDLIGLATSRELRVTDENTALAFGSGSLKVFATPAMIQLIEQTANQLVEKNLPDELTSVGISLDIKHIAPTPISMTVRAEVKIVSVEGRRIIFDVVVNDELEEIGHGSHERFIVDKKKFQSKADAK